MRPDPVSLGGWRGTATGLIAGMLLALGQAPFALWPLALAGLVLAMLRATGASSPGNALARGFSVGFGFALIALSWIVEPFLVDAARFGVLAPFALAAMAAGFGLFWGGGFMLGHWLSGGGRGWRAAPAHALGWTVAELARSYLFTGFPWALVAYIWVGTPVYRLAAVTGPHGVNLVTFLFAAVLAVALVRAARLAAFAAVIGGAAIWLAAAVYPAAPGVGDAAPTAPVVRLVQPNAPQRLKWRTEWRDVFFERLLSLSAEPGSPDVVIWPEVAVTFALNSPDAPYDRIVAAAGGRPVILGGLRFDGEQARNSLLVLDAGGTPQALYDKAHLVPFGEYLPGGPLLARLGLKGLADRSANGFAPGPGPVIIDRLGPGLSFLPMICYEAIFPHELRRAGPARPDFLLHLTNDAWFGNFAGPAQHLAQARARAIEFGLPVVRVANTGISAMIDAGGRVTGRIALGQQGMSDLVVPPALTGTPYWRWGDSPVFVTLIVVALALALMRAAKPIDRARRLG